MNHTTTNYYTYFDCQCFAELPSYKNFTFLYMWLERIVLIKYWMVILNPKMFLDIKNYYKNHWELLRRCLCFSINAIVLKEKWSNLDETFCNCINLVRGGGAQGNKWALSSRTLYKHVGRQLMRQFSPRVNNKLIFNEYYTHLTNLRSTSIEFNN